MRNIFSSRRISSFNASRSASRNWRVLIFLHFFAEANVLKVGVVCCLSFVVCGLLFFVCCLWFIRNFFTCSLCIVSLTSNIFCVRDSSGTPQRRKKLLSPQNFARSTSG